MLEHGQLLFSVRWDDVGYVMQFREDEGSGAGGRVSPEVASDAHAVYRRPRSASLHVPNPLHEQHLHIIRPLGWRSADPHHSGQHTLTF